MKNYLNSRLQDNKIETVPGGAKTFEVYSNSNLSTVWTLWNDLNRNKSDSLILGPDILLNVFLAIAVDNLAGGGGKKKVE